MITCEEGLAPSQRPFENGTKQTHIIFQFKQTCFYLPTVNHNDIHKLLHISRLFDQQPFFVRNGLKMTPIQRQSILNFIFTWDDGETKDRAKISMSSLFERLLINNFKSLESRIWSKCMITLKRLHIRLYLQSRKLYTFRGYQ